jgi:zinc protease
MTREQVAAHHAKFWTPRNAVLSIVTDRDPAEVTPLVEQAFGPWKGGDRPKVDVPAAPSPKAAVVRRDIPRAQTNLFVGHAGIERKDPDFVALEAMDNVFGTGAGFTDRLSKAIRDQAGLAYSVHGNVTRSAGIVPGTFVMYAGTEPKDAAKALSMMREQLALLLAAPPSADEVAGAKAAMRGNMVESCATSGGLLGLLRLCERYGLGFDYPRRYLEALEKVTADEILRVAKVHLHPDALVEVIVGPAAEPETPSK